MILEKLKKSPNDLILLIGAAIGVTILLIINILVFEPMSKAVYIYGILDFEFAWTKEQIDLIFTVWGPLGMALQEAGVYWDFLYILGYVTPLFAFIVYFSRRLGDRIATIGLYISLTPIVAGIFDIIENINLLIMLNETPNFASFVPFIASISAVIKFGFLLVGAIFFLIALVLVIIKKIKKQD
ncbi:MAG: hypothetical protein ACXABG_03405 [Promethearchaeota archaeon]|jgi:hypothetical protein